MSDAIIQSGLLGTAVTLGNLAIWTGLASSITCVLLYWAAMLRVMRSGAAESAAPAEEAAQANGGGKKKGGRRNRARAAAAETPQQGTERIGLWARRFFFLTCACFAVGAVCLWTLIFNQQYIVAYVQKNSNSALPFGFRFASFWSDQEGTFFLWGLLNTALGTVLILRARPDERWVMPFFSLVNVSLFTLLTLMNPFWIHPVHEVRTVLTELMTQKGLLPEQIRQELGFLPNSLGEHLAYYFGWGKYWRMTDGRGLNESLQNFWMVIHPPTLFVGYSSMMVPASFALGALMRRDYDGWVTRAASWLTFSWAVLGTGIFLGAYWAYETLGWGGYWSWDPVENSSIIPWVIGTAMIHGLLAQRARGNLKQANLFLGVAAGIAVLLSSFLVRSGVLSETSVHAFASPQKGVFITLLAVLILWTVMSVGIWLWRYRDIQSEIAYESVWERHFGFFLGMIVLSATAGVIAFGVTLPIWKPWLGLGKGNVDYTFYNKALLPVVFVMVLLMGITPLMPWRRARENARPLRPLTIAILVLSGLVSIFFLFAAFYAWQGGFRSQNDPAYVAFGLITVLALLANVTCLARAVRGGFLNTGPWLAHIGFIVMLAGVVTTSRFNTTHSVQALELGESTRVLGRQFIFRGEQEASGPADRPRMLIDMVGPNGKVTRLAPKVFITTQSGEPKPMAWPAIVHEWFGGVWGDIYISPSALVQQGGLGVFEGVHKDAKEPAVTELQLRKTTPTDVASLRFLGLDTSEMQKAMQGGGAQEFMLYADAELVINGVKQRLRPALRYVFTEEGLRRQPVPLAVQGTRQGTGYTLLFRNTNLKPGELTADFALVPDEPVPFAAFQVLHVPGIQVLWFGCYILFAGAFMCYFRRARLARRAVTERVPAGAPAVRGERIRTPEPAGAE